MASSQILNSPYYRAQQLGTRSRPNINLRLSGDLCGATRRDPKATALSIAINGLCLLGIVWFSTRKMVTVVTPTTVKTVTLVDPLPPPPPLPIEPPKAVVMSGGGGHTMPLPVTRGNPPKPLPKPILLLTAAPKIVSRLPIQPAIDMQPDIKMAKVNLPTIGMSNAPAPTVVASMGNDAGAGLGSGSGNGLGSGAGGNFGGGVFKVGGGVSQPLVLFAPDPGFTEEARRAKASGKVVVYLQVNQEGSPMHVRVLRGLGLGLDEKAVEAVRQYRFKPAMKDGHPVVVEMNVEVNFQIF